MSSSTQQIVIQQCRVERSGSLCRATAQVNGVELWFESPDAELSASPEAFASALLIPALDQQSRLVLDQPLDPLWRGNVESICERLHEWWGYAKTPPIDAPIGSAVSSAARHDVAAQCFSGGCDSFYSLLRGGHNTQSLVLVHGFDISHFDRRRFEHARRSASAVAAATGKRLIVVRTNLRKHRTFSASNWERTHGGALAAIGHLLSPVFQRLVIPSSYTYDDPNPWGSHWQIDPLWTSSRMEIFYDDASLYRLNKLQRMASEPLVREHLRVCYENSSATGNCSRCDKCVRTMLQLEALGERQNYSVFDRRTPLVAILDSHGVVPDWLAPRYEALIAQGLAPDLVAAIRRMLARTKPPRAVWWRGVIRKVRSNVARWS
ncbi:MAG: hypothetical protein U0939_18700 [Pirellulales bacterium]